MPLVQTQRTAAVAAWASGANPFPKLSYVVNLRPSLGAVAFVGAKDGQKLGRDRRREVQSLLVLVVGDRQVEGPEISSLAASSAGRGEVLVVVPLGVA